MALHNYFMSLTRDSSEVFIIDDNSSSLDVSGHQASTSDKSLREEASSSTPVGTRASKRESASSWDTSNILTVDDFMSDSSSHAPLWTPSDPSGASVGTSSTRTKRISNSSHCPIDVSTTTDSFISPLQSPRTILRIRRLPQRSPTEDDGNSVGSLPLDDRQELL